MHRPRLGAKKGALNPTEASSGFRGECSAAQYGAFLSGAVVNTNYTSLFLPDLTAAGCRLLYTHPSLCILSFTFASIHRLIRFSIVKTI